MFFFVTKMHVFILNKLLVWTEVIIENIWTNSASVTDASVSAFGEMCKYFGEFQLNENYTPNEKKDLKWLIAVWKIKWPS